MRRESETLRGEFLAIATRRGQKFPEALRARGAAFARAERRAGRSFVWVAEALGVSEQTVRRWLAGETGRATFVPVEVVEEVDRAESACMRALVTPKGYRVEGLSLDEVARLLRDVG